MITSLLHAARHQLGRLVLCLRSALVMALQWLQARPSMRLASHCLSVGPVKEALIHLLVTMGENPLITFLVALLISLLIVSLLFCLISLIMSMAPTCQLPRASEQPPLSPITRVTRADGPLNSLGPHNILRVLVSSAILDVLIIRSGVLRLGGPYKSTVKLAMADQYSLRYEHSMWPRIGPVSQRAVALVVKSQHSCLRYCVVPGGGSSLDSVLLPPCLRFGKRPFKWPY